MCHPPEYTHGNVGTIKSKNEDIYDIGQDSTQLVDRSENLLPHEHNARSECAHSYTRDQNETIKEGYYHVRRHPDIRSMTSLAKKLDASISVSGNFLYLYFPTLSYRLLDSSRSVQL